MKFEDGKDSERTPSRPLAAVQCTRMHTRASSSRVPRMSRHSSGQARVRLSGKTHYLGVWGSPASHAEYARLTTAWLANNRQPLTARPMHAVEATSTIADIRAKYEAWLDAAGRYRKHGKETSARRVTRIALRRLCEFVGAVPVRGFNEALLLQWRDRLEAANPNWARSTINRYVHRVSMMLQWGQARGFVPKSVWSEVSNVAPLKSGDCAGRREHGRVRRAVSVEDVEAVAVHCCRQVAAMMRLQSLTAMRPGEVCNLRWCDIDKNGADGNWRYTVVGAKTAHHGHQTRYLLGPRAQAILEQFPATPRAYIFSPAVRMAERRVSTAPSRRTFNAKWHPVTYRQHVVAACAKARVQMFCPHELRHGAITRVVEAVGLTAASAVANHRSVAMTARYYHQGGDEAARAVAALDRIG